MIRGRWEYNTGSLRLKGDDIKGYYGNGWEGSWELFNCRYNSYANVTEITEPLSWGMAKFKEEGLVGEKLKNSHEGLLEHICLFYVGEDPKMQL